MYNGIETFGAIAEFRAKEYQEKRFIRFEKKDLTYNQFHFGGNKVANAFTKLNLIKGDKCAVMLPNCPEFLITWLGLTRIGVVEVPVNTGLRGDLLAHVLNQAECKAIVIDAEWVNRIPEIHAELEFLEHVIVLGESKQQPNILTYSFQQLIDNASDDKVNVPIEPSDRSLILFTSGTTGPSKGAVLSHRANFTLSRTCCDLMDYSPHDRLFTMFPLYHVNARYATILAALLAGSDVVMHNRFSASRFWDVCRREQITTFNYMGSLLTILMKQPERPDDKDNPVRQIQGAPCPPQIYESFQERFDIKITEAYGSTEVGLATVNRAETFRKGSCGKAVPNFEVEIHDENGETCPPNTAGEIVVRPKEPSIMFSEYFGMPEATIKSWKNLWFHTGDRGRMDEDGYFYFVDRQKDVVRRRGENISSYEVERTINKHPKVQDTAIIGVPSELTEEEVMAVVSVRDGMELTPEELLDACQDGLPHFAVPRYVRFVKEFPRTPSQRIEKYKLRKQGVTSDTWDRDETGYKVAR
ncbi:crotonobetaine/carnitine-CoA ligase [Lentibacillus persicus]|uniref:Crotonobetaine/carnitine-CoA ligase n=1 Tax=Lentibacillus persicus TaxID=640948 RepID=A0A1I1S9K3_9BACI|nr:ATP-dependent acyl-CoA ligase [Lentibacillus persicus]SFD43126.1 crotonobetaine/carnitine-CoA ligase [Lentibacillus persicus]